MSKDHWENLKNKGSEVLEQVQKNEVVQEVSSVAKKNPKEAVLVTLMALGLIFSFTWAGSLVVGICAALYVPWTIKHAVQYVKDFYRRNGRFASLMLGIAFLYLLIHTFWFVLGFAAALTVKLLFQKDTSTTTTTTPKK